MATLNSILCFFISILFANSVHGMDRTMRGNQTPRYRLGTAPSDQIPQHAPMQEDTRHESWNQTPSARGYSSGSSSSGIQHGGGEGSIPRSALKWPHHDLSHGSQHSDAPPPTSSQGQPWKFNDMNTELRKLGLKPINPRQRRTLVEPAEVSTLADAFDDKLYDLGQIVQYRNERYIIDTTHDGTRRTVSKLSGPQEEIFHMIRRKMPRNPKQYRIPPIKHQATDEIQRSDIPGVSMLEKVGTVNSNGLIISDRNEVKHLRDYDELWRYAGHNLDTGRPMFEPIASSWKGIWLDKELFRLIQEKP